MTNRLREFPLLSTAVALLGGTTLGAFLSQSEKLPDILQELAVPIMFGSPLISGALAVPAAIDLFSKDRSGLSKIFSAAATGLGLLGLAAPWIGPQGAELGIFLYSAIAMTAAGGLNLAAYLTRNVNASLKVDLSVSPVEAAVPPQAQPPQQQITPPSQQPAPPPPP